MWRHPAEIRAVHTSTYRQVPIVLESAGQLVDSGAGRPFELRPAIACPALLDGFWVELQLLSPAIFNLRGDRLVQDWVNASCNGRLSGVMANPRRQKARTPRRNGKA